MGAEWAWPVSIAGAVCICFFFGVFRKSIGSWIKRRGTLRLEKTSEGWSAELAESVEATVKKNLAEIGPPLDTAKESMDQMLRQLEPLAKKLEADQSIKEKWAEIKASISSATGATEAAEENLNNLKKYDWKKFFDQWRPWEKDDDQE